MPKAKAEKKEKPAKKEAKGKAVKAKKDKNAPKKGLGAYMFFSQEKRPEVKAANPDFKVRLP
jgi:hypothetical protein